MSLWCGELKRTGICRNWILKRSEISDLFRSVLERSIKVWQCMKRISFLETSGLRFSFFKVIKTFGVGDSPWLRNFMSTGRRCLAPLSLASGFLLNLSWSGWIAKHGVDWYYSCFFVKQFHVTSPVEVPRVFRLPSIIPPIFLLGSSFRILQFSQYLRKGQAFPAADFYLPWILTPGLSPISGTGQRLLCACTLDLLGNFWNVGHECNVPVSL